jgi:hypothetical protein
VTSSVPELVELLKETAPRPLHSVNGNQPDNQDGSGSHVGGGLALAATRLDEIEMRPIEYVEKPHLPRAAFVLVAGPKGVGKGTWISRKTANMTTGVYGRARNVLLVSSEDSAAIDIRPRLRAAGGDDSRVYLIRDAFSLPRDLNQLRDLALEIGDVGLIVIDPVGNHLGGADTDKEGAIRHALAGLNRLADELDCTILGIRHLGKARMNGALAAVLGSVAWVDLPRTVLGFAPDDEDDMVFHVQVLAGNRSGKSAAQGYRIELRDIGLGEPVTYATEMGETGKSVDQLLATTSVPRGAKRAGAKDIILRELANGPQTLDHLKAVAATEADAASDTVWRAANELKAAGKVKNGNSGPGTTWHWWLADKPTAEVNTTKPHD